MKKIVVLALSCLLLMTCLLPMAASALTTDDWICSECYIWVNGDYCPQCTRSRPTGADAQEQYLLSLNINFEKNMIFSKHDVEILINGEKAFTMEHGVSLDGNIIVPAGRCELVIRMKDSYTSDTRFVLNVVKDAVFAADMSTHFYGIELMNVSCSAQMYDTRLRVGESAIANGARYTVLGMTQSRGNSMVKPADGYIFVLVEFEVVNLGNKTIGLDSKNGFTAYCDGYTVQPSSRAASVAPMGFANSLGPAEKMKGMICYELPVNWQVLELSYRYSVLSNEELYFVIYH